MSHARGVTLVEILVSISVIAVLTGILVTALAPVKARAAETKSLSNLRGLGVTMESYALAHASQYPWAETGAALYFPPEAGQGSNSAALGLLDTWSLHLSWPWMVHNVAPWGEHAESWLSPGAPWASEEHPWEYWTGNADASLDRPWPSYHYSNSFVASPRVWSGEPVTEEAIAPVLTADVVNPSLKALMFDGLRAYLREGQRASFGRPLLFADGSARALFARDATRPVKNPLRQDDWPARRYHDTPNGVEGVDH